MTDVIKEDVHPVFKALPLGRALVAGKHGLFLVNTHDHFIAKCLMHAGEYSEGELETFGQLDLRNCVVIEVGANIGSLSIPMAKYLQDRNCRLVCYEPQARVYEMLCANVTLNALSNVELKQLAVSNKSGTLYTNPINYDRENNFGGVAFSKSKKGHPISVMCTTIDCDFEHSSQRVGLIKIDVEGNELVVLEGAVTLIKNDRPCLYFQNDRLELSMSLLTFTRDLGYTLYWDCPYLLTEDNFFKYKPEPSVERLISVNVLALPTESLSHYEKLCAALNRVDDLNWHPLIPQTEMNLEYNRNPA